MIPCRSRLRRARRFRRFSFLTNLSSELIKVDRWRDAELSIPPHNELARSRRLTISLFPQLTRQTLERQRSENKYLGLGSVYSFCDSWSTSYRGLHFGWPFRLSFDNKKSKGPREWGEIVLQNISVTDKRSKIILASKVHTKTNSHHALGACAHIHTDRRHPKQKQARTHAHTYACTFVHMRTRKHTRTHTYAPTHIGLVRLLFARISVLLSSVLVTFLLACKVVHVLYCKPHLSCPRFTSMY
eukprot:2754787-Pleurochrysis_carterae.AAC.1